MESAKSSPIDDWVLVSTKRKRKRKEVVRLSRRGSAVGSALSAVGVSESIE